MPLTRQGCVVLLYPLKVVGEAQQHTVKQDPLLAKTLLLTHEVHLHTDAAELLGEDSHRSRLLSSFSNRILKKG